MKEKMNNQYDVYHDANPIINSITKAIRTGSSTRGSLPGMPGKIKFDFFERGNKLENKLSKDKLGIFADPPKQYAREYGGTNNVQLGLAYIQQKVIKKMMLTDSLYGEVLSSICKTLNKHEFDCSKPGSATHLIEKLISEIEQGIAKWGTENNVRLFALQSILKGYVETRNKVTLTETSEQIIELLTLRELYLLISMFGTSLNDVDEKIKDNAYMSCVDLFSTVVVLHLGKKSEILSALRPVNKIVEGVEEFNVLASNFLTSTSGQDALHEGLAVLEHGDKFSKKDKDKKLPGFKLSTILSQEGGYSPAHDIAVYYEVGGLRETAQIAKPNDPVACVGRTSETLFLMSDNDIINLTKDVAEWCNSGLWPKTLCVDLTITKSDDELVQWMLSEPIQTLVNNNKLDILVWQSEQKQHSLGTGKFSAGSSYLLTANQLKNDKFNQAALLADEKAPDNNLSTFFRKYCTDAMHLVVKQQTQTAQQIAQKFNECLIYHPNQIARAVANGSFIGVLNDDNMVTDLMKDYWNISMSFGFGRTTISSSWEENYTRISIGLESPAQLLKAFETAVEAEQKHHEENLKTLTS